MRIIEPSVELITERDNMKRIELCGRVSYKSEGKITDGSAERFVKMLMKNGHDSPLEHSNICLQLFDWRMYSYIGDIVLESVTYGRPIPIRLEEKGNNMYASGNVRAWRNLIRESAGELADFAKSLFSIPEISPFLQDLKPLFGIPDNPLAKSNVVIAKYLPWLEGKEHNILTMRFTCSRAVSHELVRHRVMSFTQESQRYVDVSNYTVIRPTWAEPEYRMGDAVADWMYANEFIQKAYQNLLALGAQKQQARDVLTNACKTEVVVTGTIPMWEQFFELRCSSAAYPEIRVLAEQAKAIYEVEALKTNNWRTPYVG